MSTLATRSKDAIVATIAAGMQGRVSTLLNFAVGSVFLAISEAVAGVALWLQGELLVILKLTRASTSEKADLDTWMADYGVARLPAIASTGTATFSRYSVSPSAPVVPVGALARTTDGSLTFVVTASPSVPTYSADAGGYVLASGLGSISVPVACLTLGETGNVQAGAISLIASTVPGLDTVTNAAPFTDGSSGETDTALRQRFVLFLSSLAKGTSAAIGFAITSLQLGLDYTVTEVLNFDGQGTPGFRVVVDDGTGSPPSEILTAATNAVDAVRAAGVRWSLQPPVLVPALVSLHITAKPGYDINLLEAAVTATIAEHINGLGLGHGLSWSRLIQIAYDTSPGVASVSSVLLNGGMADIDATPAQTIKSSGVVIG